MTTPEICSTKELVCVTTVSVHFSIDDDGEALGIRDGTALEVGSIDGRIDEDGSMLGSTNMLGSILGTSLGSRDNDGSLRSVGTIDCVGMKVGINEVEGMPSSLSDSLSVGLDDIDGSPEGLNEFEGFSTLWLGLEDSGTAVWETPGDGIFVGATLMLGSTEGSLDAVISIVGSIDELGTDEGVADGLLEGLMLGKMDSEGRKDGSSDGSIVGRLLGSVDGIDVNTDRSTTDIPVPRNANSEFAAATNTLVSK